LLLSAPFAAPFAAALAAPFAAGASRVDEDVELLAHEERHIVALDAIDHLEDSCVDPFRAVAGQ
jgi:hypothetical protein